MEVLLLTTLFSVVFAVFFLALFIRDRQNRSFGGIEREALLPLDDDSATPPISGESDENLKDLKKDKAPGSSAEKTSV